jgi:hypothetical protein
MRCWLWNLVGSNLAECRLPSPKIRERASTSGGIFSLQATFVLLHLQLTNFAQTLLACQLSEMVTRLDAIRTWIIKVGMEYPLFHRSCLPQFYV